MLGKPSAIAKMTFGSAALSKCDRCRFHARSPYLVCAVHPEGPESDRCRDFEPLSPEQQALRGGYYAGDWLPMPLDHVFSEEEWLAFWGPEDLVEDGQGTLEP